MTIELSWGSVTAAASLVGAAAKVVHWLFEGAIEKRDARIKELEGAFKAARATEATLFDKLDKLHNEFLAYKLYVAETYVMESKLKDAMSPMVSRLDSIERDLRRRGDE